MREQIHKHISFDYFDFASCLIDFEQWNPLVLNGYFVKGYNWADYLLMVINVIYTAEVIGKIIAYGFYDDHIMFDELGLPYPKNEITKNILVKITFRKY